MRFSPLLAVPLIAAAGVLVASTGSRNRVLPDVPRADGSVTLPNGWTIKPAGRAIPLVGDMPLEMSFTPDGKRLLVVTGGWHNQGLVAIDPESEKVVDNL